MLTLVFLILDIRRRQSKGRERRMRRQRRAGEGEGTKAGLPYYSTTHNLLDYTTTPVVLNWDFLGGLSLPWTPRSGGRAGGDAIL